MNVAKYLLDDKNGASTALITPNDTYTYAELSKFSAAVAAFLVRAGGHPGDRVFLLGENTFSWVAAYLGVLFAGLTAVPLPAKSRFADVQYVASSTAPKFAFLQDRYLSKFASALNGAIVFTDRDKTSDGLPISISALGHQAPEIAFASPDLEADALATLMFTSGSTGKPRGVMVSVRNIITCTDSIIEYLSLTASDRIMAVLPFHYCFGTSLLHTHLRIGGSLVIEPRFLYPEKVLERMRETECTGFAGVPSHYQILLRRSSLAKMRFPRLRYVQQAGGHLAPGFLRQLRNALPGTDIFVMYGLTEASPRLSYLPPNLLDSKIGSIGKGMPGVKLFVLDESDQPIGPGQVGRIVAEGENVALGYWRDEIATARTFRHGRLYTSDLATVDNDGFIYIVDRDEDFIKCGGQRVSCRSIEDVLLESDLLVEAAVIGVPDAILGEAAKAFVVPCDPFLDASEPLRQFCRSRLPAQLIPKEIVCRESLPKNTSGKLLKSALRQHGPGNADIHSPLAMQTNSLDR